MVRVTLFHQLVPCAFQSIPNKKGRGEKEAGAQICRPYTVLGLHNNFIGYLDLHGHFIYITGIVIHTKYIFMNLLLLFLQNLLYD